MQGINAEMLTFNAASVVAVSSKAWNCEFQEMELRVSSNGTESFKRRNYMLQRHIRDVTMVDMTFP